MRVWVCVCAHASCTCVSVHICKYTRATATYRKYLKKKRKKKRKKHGLCLLMYVCNRKVCAVDMAQVFQKKTYGRLCRQHGTRERAWGQ